MNLEALQSIADVQILMATIDGAKHSDYVHVTELRDLYHKIISGKDIDTLLKQFVRREDPEMFHQRVQLTQSITPSVSAQLMAPFYKITRVNNITFKIDFPETEGFSQKKQRVETAIKEYNGDNTLDDFMDTRFIELSFTDPNTFLVTDFYDGQRNNQGTLIGPVTPYPIEVSSYQAVNYLYVNNSLKWLIAEFEGRYVMYLSQWAVAANQIAPEMFSTVPKGAIATVFHPEKGEVVVYRTQENKLWLIEAFEHKSEKIPAKRVGYKRDLSTEGRTYVSPLHDAMPYFMKSIKTVSEFDLTMALHAHPQKLQQSPRCMGTAEKRCSGGYDPEGNTCSQCGGSGILSISTSTQDAIVVPMAKHKEDEIDLANLVRYVDLPVALLEFQDKHIKELKQEALQAMYNSDVFSRTTVVATATEKKQSMESVYDVLMPFSKQYSAVYKHQIVVISEYVDAKEIMIEHKFPKDFGFRTRDELIAQLSTAAESGMPSYIKKAFSRELSNSCFVDQPQELKRIEIKEMFYPFSDKNEAELAIIINSDITSQYDKVLWANFDQIFDQLELEQDGKGIYLYDLAPEKIGGMLTAKVIEKIQAIEKPSLVLDLEGLEETSPDQTEAQEKLTGLVGFATTIIEFQKAVSTGTSTKEAAAFSLHKLSGWPIDECEKAVGDPKPLSEIVVETGGGNPIP